MAKVAKAAPGTVIRYPFEGESLTFQFGDDGTRQVTEKEARALEEYSLNGAVKVEVVDEKTTKSKQGDE